MGLMKNSAQRRRVKDKPFGAVELATLNSKEWETLNRMEAHVYNTLKTFYKGEQKSFTAPFHDLKQRTRIKHGKTLDQAIKGLNEKGWLEVVRYAKHGTGRGLRVRSNEYSLSFAYDFCRW